jgi:hypothetical protein
MGEQKTWKRTPCKTIEVMANPPKLVLPLIFWTLELMPVLGRYPENSDILPGYHLGYQL